MRIVKSFNSVKYIRGQQVTTESFEDDGNQMITIKDSINNQKKLSESTDDLPILNLNDSLEQMDN